MNRVIFIVFIVLLSLLVGCIPGEATQEDSRDAAEKSPPSEDPGNTRGKRGEPGGDFGEEVFAVNITPVYQGEITDYLLLSGNIKVQSSVSIVSDVNGDVTEVYVKIGQKVKNGQILMKVDSSKPGQSFEPRLLRSTISGTVVSLPVELGSSVAVGTRVAEVAKTADLEIAVNIPERFVAVIQENSRGVARLEAFPDEVFKVFISEVNPVLDPASRSLEVTLSFSEKDQRIKAGMFALVKIIVEQKQQAIQIPSECIIYRFGENYVYVVKDERAVERSIITGIEIDNRVEILDGIEADDLIVVQGQRLLSDQAKVRIIQTVDVLNAVQEL